VLSTSEGESPRPAEANALVETAKKEAVGPTVDF